MNEKARKKHQKDMILIIGSLLVGIICIGMVGWLQYQSMTYNKPLPEYAIAFFASIATLVFGFTFGRARS